MSRPPEAAKSVRSDSGRVPGEKDCQYRYRDVSGYKTSLVLFEGAVLEVPVKDQSETQSTNAGGTRNEFVDIVGLQVPHISVHGVPPTISVGSCHRGIACRAFRESGDWESCIPQAVLL